MFWPPILIRNPRPWMRNLHHSKQDTILHSILGYEFISNLSIAIPPGTIWRVPYVKVDCNQLSWKQHWWVMLTILPMEVVLICRSSVRCVKVWLNLWRSMNSKDCVKTLLGIGVWILMMIHSHSHLKICLLSQQSQNVESSTLGIQNVKNKNINQDYNYWYPKRHVTPFPDTPSPSSDHHDHNHLTPQATSWHLTHDITTMEQQKAHSQQRNGHGAGRSPCAHSITIGKVLLWSSL